MSSDMDINELEKLINSLEFENQCHVKLIEKENQLINNLEAQIYENNEQTRKLEEDLSRYDEETKRLHKQYTHNRDNIESLKQTKTVMMDHELALIKQLETLKVKTDENSKFYKEHVANYSNIRDDYMRKYKAFPLAMILQENMAKLEEDKVKVKQTEEVEAELKAKIASIEDELDSKVMTRIVVKIAKTKAATNCLEKEIQECLTEKTLLLEKLSVIQEINQNKYPQPTSSSNEEVEEMNIETDTLHKDTAVDGSDITTFANMTIDDVEATKSLDKDEQNSPQSGHNEQIREVADEDYVMRVETNPVSLRESQIKDQQSQMCVNNTAVAESNRIVTSQHFKKWDNITSQNREKPESIRSQEHPASQVHVMTAAGDAPMLTSLPVRSSPQTPVSSLPRLRAIPRPFVKPTLVKDQQPQQQTQQTPQPTRIPVPHFVKNTTVSHASETNMEKPNVVRQPSSFMPRLNLPRPPQINLLAKPTPRFQPAHVLGIEHTKEGTNQTKLEMSSPATEANKKLDGPNTQLFLPTFSNPPNEPTSKETPGSLTQQNLNKLGKQTQVQYSLPARQIASRTYHQSAHEGNESATVNPPEKLHNVPTVNVIISTSSMLTTSTPSVSSTSKPSMLASTTTKSNMPSDNKPGVSTVNKYSVVTSETTKTKERSPEIQKPSTANNNVLFEKAQNQDQPLFKLNPNITALKKKPGTDSSTPPKDLQTSSNVNTPKSFLSMFGNFDKETSDEEETAPSSIFKLFNFSGNTRDKNENSPQPSQTPFGKFMDTPDSDTDSEKGPTSLFNLFHKTGNWESGESGFTINFNAEKDGANAGGSTLFQEEDGTDKKGLFNFGAADDSFDGERPMFNLF